MKKIFSGLFLASLPLGLALAEDELIHPPIPIQFALKEEGFVTLVIEDTAGKRVRNLVSETHFDAGKNVAWWDGLDDLGRDTDATAHAVYHVPGKLVAPGNYKVRGLFRQGLDLRYEFTIYNPGNPPWPTGDRSSEWFTNHTPPMAVCFTPAGTVPPRGTAKDSPPQVLVGSYVAEGGSGLAWLDLSGHKLHGQMWLGGVWTGSQFLTRDAGDKSIAGVYAYSASSWPGDQYNDNKSELRLHLLVNDAQKLRAPGDKRMGTGEDPAILSPTWKFPSKEVAEVNGLAAWNGLLVVSLTKMNQVLFVDVAARKTRGTAELPAPHGLIFNAKGQLFALSGKKLHRYDFRGATFSGETNQLPVHDVLIKVGLEDPQGLALDATGNLYISDRGASHQVKVFSPDGKLLRTIGHAGAPQGGRYDPLHMNNPKGITIDSENHLWVAEEHYAPKRVSIWTLEGKFVNAFYGPPQYGGGGTLDPLDPSRFYYNGMEFHLDWKSGASQLVGIYFSSENNTAALPIGDYVGKPPERAIYFEGHQYLVNDYNTHPTNGADIASIWLMENGIVHPVAAMGLARAWDLFKTEPFQARLPKNTAMDSQLFVWSDANADGKAQPEEVAFFKGNQGCFTVADDLSFLAPNINDHAMRFVPVGFTKPGAPLYDVAKGVTLVEGAQPPVSSGGGQSLVGKDGWTVLTNAPKPFSPHSVGGAHNGEPLWSYPSLWHGLHASHIAPMPDHPGEIIGTTRLLGPAFTPRKTDVELWAINGNKGNVYLFTTDGLFVATLFKDCRQESASWAKLKKSEREMSLNKVSLQEESFWPTLTQTRDGNIYIVADWPSVIRVDGLETIRRLPDQNLTVSAAQLAAAKDYFLQTETARQQAKAPAVLSVTIRPSAPATAITVDGQLDDWAGAQWVTIDKRATQEGDWGRRDVKTEAAVAVSGEKLYVAYKTDDANLLNNSGESLPNLFKTGGCLDLMIGTDAKADSKRNHPVAGDLRLLVSRVKGKTVAVLYRPVAPGTTTEPIAFSSPLRTIRFDRVEDVSNQIELASALVKNEKKAR